MRENTKTILAIIGAILAVILIVVVVINSFPNKAIRLEEKIATAQLNVENKEAARKDFIPDIINYIKIYDKYQGEILMRVYNARGVDTDELAEHIISLIKDAVNDRPELNNSEDYKLLMDKLTTIENQIVNARNKYNACVERYNKYIVKFPNKQILDMQGYKCKDYVMYEN